MLGLSRSLLMNMSAAKPKANAGNSSGDMKSRSAARINGARLRAIASDAAGPGTTEMIVVQKATTRLFHAARCIWSASISAAYQRSERPAGGNRNDSDAVSEVISTISVGATRKTSATAESSPNTALIETMSHCAQLCARTGLAPASDRVEDRHDPHDADHKDDREPGRV